MPWQVFLLTIALTQLLNFTQSDQLLFNQGYIKFVRYGKRQIYYDVENIDSKLIGADKRFMIVKSKFLQVLHPESVRNLPNLRDLFMAKCAITTIEPKAFHNLPNLTNLHLEDNRIREIKKGVFNGLPVSVLTLHRNEIRKIDTEAFDNMPNLFRIKANSNKLKTWDSGWFKNVPKLTEVYFRRNRINFLPTSAFANIKGWHQVDGVTKIDTKIFLSKNKLGVITPDSFYGLEMLSQLYLDRNNITEVPEGAFRDLKEIDVIYLARNRIVEVRANAFPKVTKIGILDLSSNLLECLPYKLVTVANMTNLEKNNGTCECIKDFKAKLKDEKRNCEISYEKELCPDE